MRLVSLAIALVALCTLAVELLLTRVFDVILYPNLGYMIITGAIFAFGLAGIYSTLRPLDEGADVRLILARTTAALSVSLLLIRAALNSIPFRFELIAEEPVSQVLWFLLMYVIITLPFFLAGLVFSRAFTAWSDQIQTLYFWDLSGAAIGCVAIIPLIPFIGPGGLILVAAGLVAVAAALFTGSRRAMAAAVAVAVVCTAVPLLEVPDYLSFVEHKGDRGLRIARDQGDSEFVAWDPISKIEVITLSSSVKNIIYDGGSQSSFLYRFGGDFEILRRQLERGWRKNDEPIFLAHFWTRMVALSHYLKRDSDQRVLVIGAAAGQETKAALAFGASHVDAIEMVGAVVDLGKEEYAEYNGNIFNDARVNFRRGEGRGFLRRAKTPYDVIQIFSNHSSSSVAAGAGALDPTYLITANAFVDYFSHLSDNGMLQINHHTYPRIISTAALAWTWTGRTDFRDHVLVVSRNWVEDETLPTILIKMRPWTREEMSDVRTFFSMRQKAETLFAINEDPLGPRRSFLTDEFYSGELSPETIDSVPYRVVPTTDDRPYFKFLRRTWDTLEPDAASFVSPSIAHFMNQQKERGGGVPMDVIHLYVTGGVSAFFALIFIVLPLAVSPVGRGRWPRWISSLAYFSCLGGGFILIELVLIHMLMHFIGYPLYTYSTVLFTVLLAAGLGSLASGRLGIIPDSRRWWWPFAGVLIGGALFLLSHDWVIATFMGTPVWTRVLISTAYIFPTAFFLGMPFPLGILAIERFSRSAVAWAWGMNGLFTVIGGLASILLSVFLGFQTAMIVGLSIYLLAALLFVRMRGARAAA